MPVAEAVSVARVATPASLGAGEMRSANEPEAFSVVGLIEPKYRGKLVLTSRQGEPVYPLGKASKFL